MAIYLGPEEGAADKSLVAILSRMGVKLTNA